jgi:hypothetical protein
MAGMPARPACDGSVNRSAQKRLPAKTDAGLSQSGLRPIKISAKVVSYRAGISKFVTANAVKPRQSGRIGQSLELRFLIIDSINGLQGRNPEAAALVLIQDVKSLAE